MRGSFLTLEYPFRSIMLPVLLSFVLTSPSIVLASDTKASETPTISITVEDCRRLFRHRPAPDVAYTPGVDVSGNPVAPADLPEQRRITPPSEIVIPLTVDLLRRHGVGSTAKFAPRGEAAVGVVAYDIATGRVSYNGETLSDPEADAIADACASAVPKK